MRHPDFLTPARLLRRRFGAGPLSSVLVAVLVLITAFVAATIPRLVEHQNTAELSYQLESIGPVARSLSGTAQYLEEWSGDRPSLHEIYGELGNEFIEARARFANPLHTATGPAVWIVQTQTLPTTLVNGSPRLLGLRLTGDPNYRSRITIVEGTAPSVWGGNDTGAPSDANAKPVDILLSTTAARSLRIHVGDVIGSPSAAGISQPHYRVTGLFEPRAHAALYWRDNPSLVPAFLTKPNLGPTFLSGSAFVNPLTVGRMGQTFADASISLYYPLAAGVTGGADADRLRSQLASVQSVGVEFPGDGSGGISLTTGSVDAVTTAVQRDEALSGFLALIASAPLGVTLAVMGLGVQAVIRARRRDIRLAMARGANGFQVRLALALEGLVLSAPGAIVVTGIAALLFPSRLQLSDLLLPALVAIAPAIMFAVLSVPRERTAARERLVGQVRVIAEVAVVLLAFLALVLLSRRGLAQSTAVVGIDPLLVATPLLLAVSIGILVLRLYPLPLRGARAQAARAPGLAGFVGSIRATRTPTIGLVGVLALVVGISIAVFSTVMLSTFDGATLKAAQDTVGADVRVDASALTRSERNAVAALPGVRDVAGVEHLDARSLRGKAVIDTVPVMLAQTASLRALRPALVAGLGAEKAQRIPVVISADLRTELDGQADLTLDGVPITVAGVLPSDSRLGISSRWMLVDSAFSNRFTVGFTPDLLLIGADPARLDGLRSAVRNAVGPNDSVRTVQSVASATRSEPAVQGVRLALLLGTVMSVLLCAIALVLSTVVAAGARARTAGILRTLGLPPRSLRVLVAWELIPVVIVAVIAGTALGLVLPFVLTAAVDLRPFSGGAARPLPVFDPGFIALVLAAFCAVVAIVGIVAVAAGERLNPSTTLKMGSQ